MSQKNSRPEMSREEKIKEAGKVEVGRTWNKPDPFMVKGKDPEKSYRFVDKKKLEQRKYEGWVPTDPDSVNYPNPDGVSNEGAPQYRELVLCEMPQKMADDRNAYYHSKAKRASEAAKVRYEREAKRLGVRTDV